VPEIIEILSKIISETRISMFLFVIFIKKQVKRQNLESHFRLLSEGGNSRLFFLIEEGIADSETCKA